MNQVLRWFQILIIYFIVKRLSPLSIGSLCWVHRQTLACSLGHWGDMGQGVDVGFLPICGCRSSCGCGMHIKAFERLQMGCTHGSGVGCVISLPQHFKLAVFMPRCSWNKRRMWYLRAVSSTLCYSCLKADCIRYPVDSVGFVFALKWINLASLKSQSWFCHADGPSHVCWKWHLLSVTCCKTDLLRGL